MPAAAIMELSLSLEKILHMSKTLGDESRLAIYRFLTTRREPVSVAEVAGQFELHPNAARSHLTRLEEAGLASSFPERSPHSGRPRQLYQASFQGMTPIFEPSAHRALSSILLDLLESLPGVDATLAEAYGRRWGQSHAARWQPEGQVEVVSPTYILAGLVRTLEAWGFLAQLGEEGERQEVLIRRCAFADLAERRGDLLCPLIHGVLDGLLSAVRPDLAFAVQRRKVEGECCRMHLVLQEPGSGTTGAGPAPERGSAVPGT